jgi:hypothetical protein
LLYRPHRRWGQSLPGEKVKVTTTVANTGDQAGSYTAQFKIDGAVETSKTTKSLDPGNQEIVDFEFARDVVASYNLQIGEKAATVTVAKGAYPGGKSSWLY